MLNNRNYSITAEDLEKAASVRLFEKAAAAEGINLSELSNSQVEHLYSNYQHSSEENTMNDQIIDLFEKQAAYEGIDLDALSDEELAYVYNNFVNNLENDYDDEDEAYEKLAEAEILGRHMARAYMDELEDLEGWGKLATAPLGADGKMSRMQAIKAMMTSEGISAAEARRKYDAMADTSPKTRTAKDLKRRKKAFEKSDAGQALKSRQKAQARKNALLKMDAEAKANANRAKNSPDFGAKSRSEAADYLKAKGRQVAGYLGTKRNQLGGIIGGAGTTRSKARMLGNLGIAGIGTLGAGAAYGASQMGKEASYEIFENEAWERAVEMLEFGKEAGLYEDAIDIRALEILEEEGYDISPLFY